MLIEDDIQNCLTVLQKGGIILYPTDTVWGIGCDATNEEAVKKILNQFMSDGIYLDEIITPVYEMPITSWQSHIQEQYKSLSNEMLSQAEFENEIEKDKVVYGVFSGFN